MFYGMWNDYFDGIYDIDDRQDYLMNYKKNFKGIKWDQKYNGPSEALIEDILLHGITAYHCISVFSKIEENSLFDINKFSYVWGKSKRVTLTHEEWFNHCYLYGNEGYTYKIVND